MYVCMYVYIYRQTLKGMHACPEMKSLLTTRYQTFDKNRIKRIKIHCQMEGSMKQLRTFTIMWRKQVALKDVKPNTLLVSSKSNFTVATRC